MADEVDMAVELEAEHLARSLAAARVAVPAGVAGECDECGDDSPRLVGGRSAPCRDRAARMARMLGRAVSAPAHTDDDEEITIMGKPPAASPPPAPVQVNIKLNPGPVLDAVRARAEREEGLTLGPAAKRLLEELLAGEAQLPDEEQATVPLDQVHFDALLAEVRARFDKAGDTAERDALAARADAAEAKLARLREALAT